MEPEGSLPHSQVPVICPYPEPARSSPPPLPHPTSGRSILIITSHLCLGLPSGLFPSVFPTKPPYTSLLSPTLATCTVYLILDSITRMIFGEQYRSLKSSCSFLHSPLTSSLLGYNILLNTLFSNTLSLHPSLNVSNQVSHPYKTKRKNIFLYILKYTSYYLK